MKKGKYYRHSLARDLDIFIIKILADNLTYLTLRVAFIQRVNGKVLGLDTIKIKHLDLKEWKELPENDDDSGNLIQ
jgi:hypothetical protein